MRSGVACATGTVAMLVTMVVLAACGGGTDSGGPMRATLTPDGCAYEGDTSPTPGVFTVEVNNQTPEPARFDLQELAEEATLEEIEPLYARASREYERTGTRPWESPQYKGPLPWPPQFTRPVSDTLVGPEGTSQLQANERTGRYVLLCQVIRKPGTGQSSDQTFPLNTYAAVELDVGPTAG